MSEQQTDTPETTCHNCEYEWNCSSQMVRVTCPSCGRKTHREEAGA